MRVWVLFGSDRNFEEQTMLAAFDYCPTQRETAAVTKDFDRFEHYSVETVELRRRNARI